MSRKIHLPLRHGVACGADGTVRRSDHPSEVTCANCIATLHMADAEISLGLTPRRNRPAPERPER